MVTLETLYSQVEEALNINSDDSTISRELIVDLITQYREVWIKNEATRGRKTNQDIVQDLGCVELELASSVECADLPIPTNCTLLKTKCEIPSFIQGNAGKMFTRIGAVDMMDKAYKLIDYSRLSFTGKGRFNREGIFAFEYNNRLYFYSNRVSFKLTKYVNIRGVLSNPLDAATFNNCNTGTTCYDVQNDSYPLTGSMWTLIKPKLVQELMMSQMIPQDDANNTKDDKTEMGGKK